jgi:hypothetical protein
MSSRLGGTDTCPFHQRTKHLTDGRLVGARDNNNAF